MSPRLRRWEKANISYKNYLTYLGRKDGRFKLTLIDLLYVSNFKGGYASIHENESSVNAKLEKYSEHLKEIHNRFGSRRLGDLTTEELQVLQEKASL